MNHGTELKRLDSRLLSEWKNGFVEVQRRSYKAAQQHFKDGLYNAEMKFKGTMGFEESK